MVEKNQDTGVNSATEQVVVDLVEAFKDTPKNTEEETKGKGEDDKGKNPAEKKLYQVIKALSAMRLCKSDSVPSVILVRNSQNDDKDKEFHESYHLYDKNKHTSEFQPCLFQGSIGCAYNKKALDDAEITHIVTAADHLNPRFPEHFKYLTLPLLDTPTQNIVKYFNTANDFIVEAIETDPKTRVLVHCFAGKSRASTIMLSFLMAKMKVPLDVGLRHVKICRPIAQPNIGFVV